jgi:hypothetical protein
MHNLQKFSGLFCQHAYQRGCGRALASTTIDAERPKWWAGTGWWWWEDKKDSVM